jgi:hypothetical protein
VQSVVLRRAALHCIALRGVTVLRRDALYAKLIEYIIFVSTSSEVMRYIHTTN